MSFTSFLKKQFIDIIQWTESDDDVLAWRFPTQDMEIQYGASLTVRESQEAIFVNEGALADVFKPGRYKLTTSTLPVLTYLKNWDKLFESPFKSEVYFFRTRALVGRRWGTTQPVTLRDKDFGAVQVRAFGQFSWSLVDVATFHKSVSGTREVYKASEVEDSLRGVLISSLATALGGSQVSFLDLAANQALLAEKVQEVAAPLFKNMGLRLDSFQVMSLTLPQAMQEALDTRVRMGMIGNMGTYTQMKAADALGIAAGNEGAGGMAALGAQMAVGVGMGQVMQQAMTGAAPAAPAAPVVAPAAPAADAAPAAEDPVAKLSNLKKLFDGGLITQADYDQAKQAILARLTS